MEPITTITATTVVLPIDDVDTDQIIPARFLKVIDKSGLGAALFADWRHDENGNPRPEFPLNLPASRGAGILIAGRNFGCGSSREHAPWALLAHGFRAVISTQFADIFRNNAMGNGLLPVALSPGDHARLIESVRATADAHVTIDLAEQTVTFPDRSTASFAIEPFEKECLLRGVDRLGYLTDLLPDIARFESTHGSGPLAGIPA